MIFEITDNPANQKVFIGIKNLRKATNQGIRKAFYLLGRDLVKTSVGLIDKKPKTGRMYRIRNRGKKRGMLINHRASAAGEAPAVITGKLRKSVTFEVQGSNRLIFGSKEFGDKPYPKFLELGTVKIAPRPFLNASIKLRAGVMQNYVDQQIQKALK